MVIEKVTTFRKYGILICFLLIAGVVNTQQQNNVRKNKKELNDLKAEIQALEGDLKKKTQKEKQSAANVENYNKLVYLTDKLLQEIKADQESISEDLITTQDSVSLLSSSIEQLKANYAKYVVSIYKYGRQNDVGVVFNSASINQVLLRMKYLKMFTSKRANDLKELETDKEQLLRLKSNLEIINQEKTILAEEKSSQEKQLELKLKESKDILSKVKKDKESVKKLIAQKKMAEQKIKNLIAKSIEEDNQRKLRAKEEKKRIELEKQRFAKKEALINKKGNKNEKQLLTSTTKYTQTLENKNKERDRKIVEYDNSNSDFLSGKSFSTLKGTLNWPTSGRLYAHFGENKNEKLNTVTLNYGIDISALSNSSVKVVADGEVSVIDWIVGYGSVIIVAHSGGYRTVYGHLTSIRVKVGERIKAGSVLGVVSESVDGNILHFEIWNERNNQNPELWLAKK